METLLRQHSGGHHIEYGQFRKLCYDFVVSNLDGMSMPYYV